MELTKDNYYSVEADREYMSCSQYQDFIKCEAAAMAQLDGKYEPSPSEALTVGNYFHTALESAEAHGDFCREHFDEIYKTKTDKKTGELIVTGKYAPYEVADRMIEACYADPLIKSLLDMDGEREMVMTGTLFNIPWKIRLDKYIPDKRLIIDYKTCADMTRTEYDPVLGEKVSFIESLGYLMRAAVYTEIERQYSGKDADAKFVIVAVSKQDPPDKGAFLLNHRQRYDFELEQMQKRMAHILDVKQKRVKPKRCGVCEYCRRTKTLNKIVPYYTLNPKFKEDKEDEYDDIFFADLERDEA